MIIYMATNKINSKSYIGQTINSLKQRKKRHLWDASNKRTTIYFHKALRKYGFNNFNWKIICKCNDIKSLNKLEAYYIKLYNTFKNGYNLTIGGTGTGSIGLKHSKDSKNKMSIAKLGKKHSKKHNKRISKSRKGQQLTDQTKNKISKAMTGKHLSKETKNKLSKLFSGKNSPTSHPIIIKDNFFESIGIAAKSLNINSGTIWKRLKRQYPEYQYAPKISQYKEKQNE